MRETSLFTAAFIKGALERALKTFCQTVLAAAAVSAAATLTGIDWFLVLDTAALAAVLSLMTSVGNADFTAGPGSDPRSIGRSSNGRFTSTRPSRPKQKGGTAQ